MGSEREEYFNWKRKSNSFLSNTVKRINLVHVSFIFAIFIFGQMATSSGKISPQVYLILVIGAGVGLMLILFNGTSEKKLLPENIIKQIAREKLNEKRRNGEIPYDSTIEINLFSDSKYEQDLESGTTGITNRMVGFEVIRKGFKKKGLVRVHPYSGEILGVWYTNNGFDIKFNKDVKLVPVGVIEDKKKSISL